MMIEILSRKIFEWLKFWIYKFTNVQIYNDRTYKNWLQQEMKIEKIQHRNSFTSKGK